MEDVMKKVTSQDGTSIAWYHSGRGEPLILVNGTGAANPMAWGAYSALQKHFSVIPVDRRGRGGSGDNTNYQIGYEFDDIAAVAEAVGEPVYLFGHSFGGLLALEATIRTQQIRKLVLYEPAIPVPGVPAYPEGITDRFQALLDARDYEGVLTTHYRDVAEMTAEEIEELRSMPSWPERLATVHTLVRESRANEQYVFDPKRFADMHVPTMLLVGGASNETGTKPAEAVDAALPDSRIVVMPGQKHIAMYTAPALFANELIGFLLDPM
jgi:pimeloyl-ACP methyl ester carboxylesterase